jgi:hypothetical protein
MTHMCVLAILNHRVLRDQIGWSLISQNVINRGLVLSVSVSYRRACSVNLIPLELA